LGKEFSSNEGPAIELARKYGLNDKQIEAMCGWESMIPKASIWGFRKQEPDDIRDLVKAYVKMTAKYTREEFVRALNLAKERPELLKKVNEDLIKLTRNATKKDASIERKLREQNSQTTQTQVPLSLPPDNNI
jgi:hypothetical protein